MKLRLRKGYLLLVFIAIIYNLLFTRKHNQPLVSISPTPSPTIITSGYIVKRVIDGDTIELTTGDKVRYIGINTPELHDPRKLVECYGHEANKYNQQLVEGKTIYLEKDVSNTDKYGRLLRYVYIDNDSSTSPRLMVNQLLVNNGYALVSTYPPDVKYVSLFIDAESHARNNNLGLWSSCPTSKIQEMLPETPELKKQ